jgi:hypothetical protein
MANEYVYMQTRTGGHIGHAVEAKQLDLPAHEVG